MAGQGEMGYVLKTVEIFSEKINGNVGRYDKTFYGRDSKENVGLFFNSLN